MSSDEPFMPAGIDIRSLPPFGETILPHQVTHMPHAAMSPNNVAVITGGASGIGLAAAMRFASLGMRVCIADLGAGRLASAKAKISSVAPGGVADVMAMAVDVSRIEDVSGLETAVRKRFGGTDILMNNAGIQPGSTMFGASENWQRILGVNLWGVIHGSQVFAPHMIARGRPGLVVNTGSKQGITTPPGDPAYNVSKAGVKAFTEALQHELRNTAGSRISAHLMIPGFVFTGLTAKGRTEKPAGAWTPEHTVDFMIERIDAGDFYILCPDNDVPRCLDQRRILWAAGDIVENRPALSRWHPAYAEAFAAFVRDQST
jgi:NAD(P)-dependent dehydrogenase (short-subunit alcohol dehydrogenase family)